MSLHLQSVGKSAGSASDLSWRLVRSADRSDEVIEFEEAVVAFFLASAELLGVPKSVAAIYGICFASPEPLSFTEISERLGISAGSISQGLRVLREVGALKVVSLPTERRDRFEPDLQLRKLVLHFIEQRLEGQLKAGRESLQAITKNLPVGSSSKVLRSRMRALQTWHDKARAALPLLKTFLQLT